MIKGAPRAVMLAFIGVGVVLVGFSFWALFITDIPQEQFEQDTRFQEEYTKYHQWLLIFGISLVIIGFIVAGLWKKFGVRRTL